RPDVPLEDPRKALPAFLIREDIEYFPEMSELDVVRHYSQLADKNFSIDKGLNPLGSCTMKYNPRINEDTASLSGFTMLHPYQPIEHTQGALRLIYELELLLKEITGLDAVTLQPAAGAQGELTGMLMIAELLKDKGESRHKVIIPDTAHGTNPASCNLAGFKAVPVKSDSQGILEAKDIEKIMDEDTAAVMITNPNTLGLFEDNIREIADVVHKKGGFLYMDGANLNAIMGLAKLSDMGVDVVQMNLHKTFSTPHGGGGPGSGPIAVTKELEPYLPTPRIEKTDDGYALIEETEKSIGRVKAFYGHFSIMVRAYTYIRRLGRDGLKEVSEAAILSANYIKEELKGTYDVPYDVPCMHECVFTDKLQSEHGVTTMDIAKRLMDYGFHPPTIYFPLIVSGALMVEPTETESIESIDAFISAMRAIAKEAEETPELVKSAPNNSGWGRIDEVGAARNPVLRWTPPEEIPD
ncbi:MAG: aminomethyl-transferring glycine dehydrogenase subunit GcvPB, partial [Proteobacteria bacterium]|nr:aminomethyl-transferring glycine dehydrogenase subunit GcvPB [Pseudomonadota bacterium]